MYVRNHVCNTVHHFSAREYVAAFAHELRDRFAIARTFHHGRADEGHGFGVVEFQAPGLAAFGQQRCGEDQQLVFFAGGEFQGVGRFLGLMNELDCDANAMP